MDQVMNCTDFKTRSAVENGTEKKEVEEKKVVSPTFGTREVKDNFDINDVFLS